MVDLQATAFKVRSWLYVSTFLSAYSAAIFNHINTTSYRKKIAAMSTGDMISDIIMVARYWWQGKP